MEEPNDIRGFLRQTEYEAAKLEKKIFATTKKLDELRNQLHDKQELQAFLAEQIEDDE